MKYLKLIILFTTSTLLFTACSSTTNRAPVSEGGFYYSGIYFGKNFSPTLKEGVEDGCETSKGIYTKDHTLFKIDTDYNTGWFLGRSRCIPLFKVKDDNKSIENRE